MTDPLPKMTDEPVSGNDPDTLDDLADLLPEDLLPTKGKAVPLVRSPAQTKKAAEKALAEKIGAEVAEAQESAQTAAQASAARLAQIVNLHIAGHSLSAIGASIGASADEVDRMLSQDAARYVRSQPALRVYVRNYISAKYSKLLDAVWTEATDKNHREKLEHQDRALRILDKMERLHGAAAPTQTEVKVDAAPDAVEALVKALSNNQGFGYDVDIFDVVDAEVVQDAVQESARALESASADVEADQPGDPVEGEGF